MPYAKITALLFCLQMTAPAAEAQAPDPAKPDFGAPRSLPGLQLVWNDEFNQEGKPDTASWRYESGFVRNRELQWYQPGNARCTGGVLLIEGRREKVTNPAYQAESGDWRRARPAAEFTSASVQTRGRHQWLFGRFEVRARIDTTPGSWPAIWTLGVGRPWPSNGEIDIMEFYRVVNVPSILANVAWGTAQPNVAKWDTEIRPLAHFTARDPGWAGKFHVWRMDWTEDSISLYLDDELLNTTSMEQTRNADGSNPFLQPHYLLLNLAIGANGGTPDPKTALIRYEVDYVRVYQHKNP